MPVQETALEVLTRLTRDVVSGRLGRESAALRAQSLGPCDLYSSTFAGFEASGHHLLMTRCAANLSDPHCDGPPYFFRDSDINSSLEQLEGINASWSVVEGVVQERLWSGPAMARTGPMIYLGTLKQTAEEVERQTSVRFIRGVDDLDVEIFANLRMFDRPFRLASRRPLDGVDLVCFEESNVAQLEQLRLALETLALDLSDIAHLTEALDTSSLPQWTLWRQDDNGNRFDMATYTSQAKAEREALRFEARLHKQTYGVRLGPD